MSEAGLMPPGHMQQVAGLQVESSVTPSQPNDYVVVDGYRLVKPYHFDFCCGVRQRWVGQTIIDIFSREFPARDRQYYLQALADGRLRVEGCQVTAKTPLKDGQRMRHFIHRHEPPVPASSIRVVGQSEEAVAVCKPHGMPVHVAGQYRKNTVLGILTAERPDLGPLFPIHRLDKPVSGLLLFARSAAAAAVLCARIDRREVEKLYVARVLGRFPTSEEPIVADVPLAWDPVSNHATAELGTAATTAVELAEAPAEEEASAVASVLPAKDEVGKQGAAAGAVPSAQQNVQQQRRQKQQAEAQAPQPQPANLKEQRQLRKQVQKQQRKHAKAERQAYAAAGASAAAKKPSKGAAKPALTEFRLLAVAEDGQTSIVECRPRTGRTHQIRVHLQFLGHPIANDTQYGGTYGGPLASRQMAQQLGMDWTTARSQQESAEVGDDGASDGVNAAAAGAARGWCSKRARLEAARANGEQNAADVAADVAAERAALGAADATETESQPEELVAAGIRERAGAVGAYAQSQAFRSRPEFQVAPELFDPMCIHCPYYAPKDYPLDLQPLWLHACTYSCQTDGWSFSTELPEWASADWVPLSA